MQTLKIVAVNDYVVLQIRMLHYRQYFYEDALSPN